MRKAIIVTLLVGALGLGLFATRATPAPALADKPPRYEYAELHYVRSFEGGFGQMGVAGMQAQLGGRGPGGGPGLPPPQMPPQAAVKTTILWTTAEEQVEVKEWEDLADRLKAPAAKKASPAAVHKLRVLNRLSDLGWEVMDRPLLEPATTGTLALRRKLP